MSPSFHVDVARQTVEVRSGESLIWQAPVSTALLGLGEAPGSYQTPRGKHHVEEKIGAGEPLGRIFKSRLPQEEIWAPGNEVDLANRENDLILTRILWLAGDEPENQSTHSRYIYFHGTNREDRIGQVDSHGCIRLRNEDMLRLFDLAETGTTVWIA
jgi:hypothetical protein